MFNTPNTNLYTDLTCEDIVDPFNYINYQKTLKLSPEDEILSKSIVEAVQKQKSVEEFLGDLEQKYKNTEKKDNEDTDLLASYGTYLISSTTYETFHPSFKRNLNIRKNNDNLSKSYINMKYKNWNNDQNNEISTNSKIELNNSILKINEIYDEYERYKKKYMNNNENIHLANTQFEELNQNNEIKIQDFSLNNKSNNYNKSMSYINRNEILGKDEELYHRNLMDFNKLSNYNISSNYENDDNNEIFIMNFKNEKDNITNKQGWAVEDGILVVNPVPGERGGDLMTVKTYGDFLLSAEFQLTEGANSGIKYFINPGTFSDPSIGCEYQILDDDVHPDAKLGVAGNRTTASLYDLIPADKSAVEFHPYDWNTAMILVRGDHVEHWLNGVRVVSYDRNSQEFDALVRYSKFRSREGFGDFPSGHILLQDHIDKVFFRNIRIKEL